MKGLAAILSGFLLLSLSCSTAPLSGPPADVSGIVTTDGAPLPGVTVTIIGPKNFARVVVSDSNGQYRFTAVPAGAYSVRFELAGFNNATHRVAVAGRSQVINGYLKVASIAEAITVTAEAPVLPPREAYTPIVENAFVDTRHEATTTFAIDVDRASYANVRRMLSQNLLPPPDSVRLEEMVNYFNYSYPQPTGNDPFSVTAEVAGCPWDPTHRLMRIGIQGRNLDEWKMAPNNLVFLLDVSGSMSPPDRLPCGRLDRRRPGNRARVQGREGQLQAGRQQPRHPRSAGREERSRGGSEATERSEASSPAGTTASRSCR